MIPLREQLESAEALIETLRAEIARMRINDERFRALLGMGDDSVQVGLEVLTLTGLADEKREHKQCTECWGQLERWEQQRGTCDRCSAS